MHVILGILSTLVTVLYLLDRMGVDLGGLNPWSWRRRRNWRNRFEGDPIYAIEDAKSVAGLLVVGAAKLDGDITVEQKQTILTEFETTFSMSSKEASELLTSSSHLLGTPQLVDTQLKELIARNGQTFSSEQARSVIEMITNVVAAGGDPTESQRAFLVDVQSGFSVRADDAGTWG